MSLLQDFFSLNPLGFACYTVSPFPPPTHRTRRAQQVLRTLHRSTMSRCMPRRPSGDSTASGTTDTIRRRNRTTSPSPSTRSSFPSSRSRPSLSTRCAAAPHMCRPGFVLSSAHYCLSSCPCAARPEAAPIHLQPRCARLPAEHHWHRRTSRCHRQGRSPGPGPVAQLRQALHLDDQDGPTGVDQLSPQEHRRVEHREHPARLYGRSPVPVRGTEGDLQAPFRAHAQTR